MTTLPPENSPPPQGWTPPPPGGYWPGPVPQAGPAKSPALGIVAMVLGVIAVVLPLAPFDLTGVRVYLAALFGIPGLVVGIIGATGHRRGKALAATGAVLCGLAMVARLIAFGVAV